ncbi:hemerythrin domain-containing protein [Embleya scabrispora]|uniref:hemerythrin domain-containing protein n=1 Tax=Embleya scabrispora TaxID=159449 RepID=UPI0003662829|nr:hemerythrin domain-containing protein [Embleya scabrispora]MYS87583.1 hemerythrin domain-containing protein [Streptomyces sp. SID5474]
MTGKTFKNDMSMMYAFHDALRRELGQIARVTAEATDDPRQVLQAALGWELFKRYLHVHHGAEDDVLWPAIRSAVQDLPDELAVIEAMEAEHAIVDPGLNAVDAALADRESGPERLAMIVERLVAGLGGHLKHEEDEALAIVDRHATPELLQRFGAEHGIRVGNDSPLYVPWYLDGAGEDVVATVLGRLPEPLRQAYRDEWQPAYAALDLWGPKQGSTRA